MNRGNLKTYCLGQVPGLKASQLSAGQLDLMIQVSCDKVAFDLLCNRTNDTFDAEGDNGEYDLTTEVSNFCAITSPGLYYNQGTLASPDWKKLDGLTEEAVELKYPSWRNADSGTPQCFWQVDDIVNVYPMPEDDLSGAFWLYFAQRAHQMDNDAQFPFGGSAQNPRLSVLDEAIGLHFKWQGYGVIGKTDDYRIVENGYKDKIAELAGKLKRNMAVTTNVNLMMQGLRPRHRPGFSQ